MWPFPHPDGRVVVVAPPPQPSQQLPVWPTVAVPPSGARHPLLFVMAHRGTPSELVRQQVTNPGFPQVDCAAQLTTSRRHCLARVPFRIACFATCATQLT
jgi:hypothetical protein